MSADYSIIPFTYVPPPPPKEAAPAAGGDDAAGGDAAADTEGEAGEGVMQ